MRKFIGGLSPWQRTWVLVWTTAFISWVGYAVFSDLESITVPVVTAFGLVVGILATVFAFLNNGESDD